ncbi:MAG: hypothetical protein ACOCU4_04230 [Alkalispirochaeta sp.]
MPSHRGALYRELYHFLTGERHGLRPSSATARDLPRPLARSLVHFYSLLKTVTLESLTVNVADLVADATARWFEQVWQDLDAGIARSSEPSYMDTAPPEKRLQEYRRLYPSAEPEWHMIARRLQHAQSANAVHAVVQLLEETSKACQTRIRETTQERALRRVVTPLADHLNRIIPDVAEADQRCRTLFRSPAEWDVFAENPAQIPWHRLERAYARLESDSDMQRLTDALVRGISRPEPRFVWSKVPVETASSEEFDGGLGDIDGLHGTSGVQLALSSELALLATPPTEDLFARKLADQDVLALHSARIRTRTVAHINYTWARVQPEYRPGPIIACLDTSGSMAGTPMDIAESILFGMVRSAVAYQRQMYVFAVRGRLRRVAIEPPVPKQIPRSATDPFTAGSPSRVKEKDLLALHRFLDAPAGGGADVSPALAEALAQVGHTDDRAIVDLVVVSDMQFPRISAAHQVALEDLQRTGLVTVHAVTIGEQPMRDPMNMFDHRWHYNTGEDAIPRSRQRPGMVGFRYERIPI